MAIGAQQLNQYQQELLRRLQFESLRFYKPHKGQLKLHSSPASKRCAFTGNQWGKTHWGCNEIAMTVGKVHPWRRNYVGQVFARDCCVDFHTIKTVLVPKYYQMLPRNECMLDWKTFDDKPAIWPGLRKGSWDKAWSEQDKTIYLEDGSFIEFKTYEQGREAHQGAQRHIVRFDEEPPEDVYDENVARQLAIPEGQNLLFTMTPLKYSQWLYSRIYEKSVTDPNICVVTGSTADNPYINEEVIKSIEDDTSDEAILAARLHGQFTVITGRVYKEYGDHNFKPHFTIPEDWHKSIVIDPHPEKPTGVLWIAEDYQGKLYVYREASIKGDVEHISRTIRSLSAHENIKLWLVDPSSKQRAGIYGKGQLVEEFRNYLPWLVLANNDFEKGVDLVRRYVKDGPNGPNLYVLDNCPLTNHQMKNYMWKPPLRTGEVRSKPEVVKRDDEGPDCIRYRVMYGLAETTTSFHGWNIKGYAN